MEPRREADSRAEPRRTEVPDLASAITAGPGGAGRLGGVVEGGPGEDAAGKEARGVWRKGERVSAESGDVCGDSSPVCLSCSMLIPLL